MIHPGIDGEVPLLVFVDGKFRQCRFQSGLFQFQEADCEVLPQERVVSLLAGDGKPTKKNKEKIFPVNLGIIESTQTAIHKSDVFLNIPSSPYERTIRLDPKKNFFIDFEKSNKSRKIKLFMDKDQSSRVILSGYLGSNDSIELSGSQDWAQLLSNPPPGRFDERLLTGCLTVIDATLDHPQFSVEGANCEDGINFIRSNGHIERIVVINSRQDAVDADFSNLTIAHISVKKAGNDCIDVSAGNYSLGNLTLSECADKALSAGEKSNVSIVSLRTTQAQIFIASKDESSVSLVHGLGSEISGKCIDIYSKKKEFDSGTFKGENYTCEPMEISPNK